MEVEGEGVFEGVEVAVVVAVAVAVVVAEAGALAEVVACEEALGGAEAVGIGAAVTLGLALALAEGVARAQAGKQAVRCCGGENTQPTCVALLSAAPAAVSVKVARGTGILAAARPAAVYSPSCQPSSAATVLAIEEPTYPEGAAHTCRERRGAGAPRVTASQGHALQGAAQAPPTAPWPTQAESALLSIARAAPVSAEKGEVARVQAGVSPKVIKGGVS